MSRKRREQLLSQQLIRQANHDIAEARRLLQAAADVASVERDLYGYGVLIACMRTLGEQGTNGALVITKDGGL